MLFGHDAVKSGFRLLTEKRYPNGILELLDKVGRESVGGGKNLVQIFCPSCWGSTDHKLAGSQKIKSTAVVPDDLFYFESTKYQQHCKWGDRVSCIDLDYG